VSEPAPLPDGTYDVFIVDAQADPADETRVNQLDLTVVTGPFKGEVMTVASQGLEGSDLDLMGMPAVLTVADGRPTVTLDD